MTFDSQIENAIYEIIGEYPCKDENSQFYYTITTVEKRDDCCLSVRVTLTLNGCINYILNKLCDLKAYDSWTFTQDPETGEYTATLLFRAGS